MDKSQFELCCKVLRKLHEQNVLGDIVLIGSWCMPFYKDYFPGIAYLSAYRTRDVDLLVPHPRKIKSRVDMTALFKDLGFVVGFQGSKGYMRLEHEDLVVEFLSPERGKGTDRPVALPQWKMNAQALRFLDFLADNTIKVKVEDFYVTAPHPVHFALHKLIISKRRTKQDKSEKDRNMAVELLIALLEKGEAGKIREVFRDVPLKWHKSIVQVIKKEKDKRLMELFGQ